MLPLKSCPKPRAGGRGTLTVTLRSRDRAEGTSLFQ